MTNPMLFIAPLNVQPPKKRRYFTTELPCSGSLYNLFLSLYNLLYNFNIKCSECLLSPTVSTHQLLFIKTPIDQYICVIVNLYKAKHHKPSLLFTSWTILTFFSCFNFFFLLFSLLWVFNIQTNITSRTSWDAKIDKNSMINLKQSALLKLENHKSCLKKKKDIYEDEKKENEVVRRRGEEKIFGKRAWGRSCFHLHSDGNTANETFIHLTYNLKVFKNQLHLFSL